MRGDKYHGLMERKEKVLKAIREFRSMNPFMNPTVRELCGLTGIESTSLMRFYLDKLADDGAIERHKRIARGIILKSGKIRPPVKVSRKERIRLLGEL